MNEFQVHHKDRHKILECHKDNKKDGCTEGKNCVKEVLEAILTVQKKAKKKYGYDTSVYQTNDEQLGKHTKLKKNTIPFILYCKDCSPFRATGISMFHDSHSKKKQFICFTTFIFKIKELDNNCAVLELLTFKSEKKPHGNSCSKCDKDNACSPCCQVDFEEENDLSKTGIFVNVDLSCFCGISILPAVSLF
jgi:hypothetical protein